MSKSKKENNVLVTLVLFVFFVIEVFIKVIIIILIFGFDLITFYKSKYKEKSGNNFLKMYFNKGNYGEFLLYRKIIRIFGKEMVLTNIYLDNINTEKTEIDLLAISNKGIYIFEMKNYSGYIYGSSKDKNWTQVLNKWTKNKFYNPLKQNYAHTQAVIKFLGIDSKLVIPIIVFSNRSKLAKININDNQKVFQFRKAIRFIKKHEKNNKNIITDSKKKEYLIKLLKNSNMTNEIKLKHINDVKELQTKSS